MTLPQRPDAPRTGARLILLFGILAAGSSPAPVRAADWAVRESDGVHLYTDSGSGAASRSAALLLELVSARDEVAHRLGVDPPGNLTVYLAPDEAAFRSLLGDRFPHWGVGAAYPQRRLIVLMPFRGSHEETLQTARHEVAHVVLHVALGENRVPTWFDEGVAMWAAGEWRLNDRIDVFFAVLSGGLTPLSELDRVLDFGPARAHLGYTQSQMAVLFLIEQGGPDAVAEVLRQVRAGDSFEAALQRVTGLTLAAFESRLADTVRGRYGLVSLATSAPALWFYAAVLMFGCFVAVRIRNRARVRAWEDEDPASALPLRLRLNVTAGGGGRREETNDE